METTEVRIGGLIPCGIVRCTSEKYPKITQIDETMLRFLRVPEDGVIPDYLELARENIYHVIPMEERQRFSRFLEEIREEGQADGEFTLLCCDGSRARLYCRSELIENGSKIHTAWVDITRKSRMRQSEQAERYLQALEGVYDKIFEYDFSNRTVTCLYSPNSDLFRHVIGVPMQLEEATENWVRKNVSEEDTESVRRFFREYFAQKNSGAQAQPPKIRYRALSSEGIVKIYTGIFLEIDSSVSLFCCRNLAEEQENRTLREEIFSLRTVNANLQERVMHSVKGALAFEIRGERVGILHGGSPICRFFGYSEGEWIRLARENPTVGQFIAGSSVDEGKLRELLDQGEAQLEWIDTKTGTPHRSRAVYSSDGSVTLYNSEGENLRRTGKIRIRTFGYFDVFVDDKPIAFRNEKSKELFALLVDRRGGYISSEEAIGFLWENEPANPVTLARYRKVALRLKNILEEYGISDVVESVNGRRRLVTEKVSCDLYNYLARRPEAAKLFKGSYLTNYSWGETTLGELIRFSGGLDE